MFRRATRFTRSNHSRVSGIWKTTSARNSFAGRRDHRLCSQRVNNGWERQRSRMSQRTCPHYRSFHLIELSWLRHTRWLRESFQIVDLVCCQTRGSQSSAHTCEEVFCDYSIACCVPREVNRSGFITSNKETQTNSICNFNIIRHPCCDLE